MFHAQNCVLLSFKSFCMQDNVVLMKSYLFKDLLIRFMDYRGKFKDLTKFFNFQGLFKGLMLFQGLFKVHANHVFASH